MPARELQEQLNTLREQLEKNPPLTEAEREDLHALMQQIQLELELETRPRMSTSPMASIWRLTALNSNTRPWPAPCATSRKPWATWGSEDPAGAASLTARSSLTDQTMVRQLHLFSTAIRVDIQSATTNIPRIHRQLLRLQQALQVKEDALHALFVEIRVLAEADDVFQQARMIQRRATIFHDTLPQSGWLVTGQLDLSRWLCTLSSTMRESSQRSSSGRGCS
jgi:hypothetical protein